jgi:hypothetical protein
LLQPADLLADFHHGPNEHDDQGNNVNFGSSFNGRAGHGAGVLESDTVSAKQMLPPSSDQDP